MSNFPIASKACFLTVASEAVRATLTASDPVKILYVDMVPIDNQVSRARGGARFNVMLRLSWVAGDWAGPVLLVDARGYPLVWKFDAVGKWLVKALSGFDCVVTVTIKGAAQVPARWTPARVDASREKVRALDAAAIVGSAAAKLVSVDAWAPGLRKAAVVDAARRMVEAVGMAEVVKGLEAGGVLGDAVVYVPPVDPPPVDPPPVDPPPVDPPPVDPPPVDPPPVDPPPASGFDMTGWTRWETSTARVLVDGYVEGEFNEVIGPVIRIGAQLEGGSSYVVGMRGAGMNALTLGTCQIDMVQLSPYGDPIEFEAVGVQTGNTWFIFSPGVSGLYFFTLYGVENYGSFRFYIEYE